MQNVIYKLCMILFVIVGCVRVQEDTAGTTATGNNGVIVGDVAQYSHVERLLANGEISSEDVSIHLYRKGYPYTVQKSTQLNDDNQFRFEQLDYATYTVRVDVGEDEGGIKENIIVENADVVFITIEINIYITNIVNNFYFGGEKADVRNLLSSYGVTQLIPNLDGSFTIKTLPGTNETSLLVTQSRDSLALGVKTETGGLVITPKTEEFEVIQSSQVLSSSSMEAASSKIESVSSSFVIISSSEPEVSSEISLSSASETRQDSLEMRFEDSNAKDTWIGYLI